MGKTVHVQSKKAFSENPFPYSGKGGRAELFVPKTWEREQNATVVFRVSTLLCGLRAVVRLGKAHDRMPASTVYRYPTRSCNRLQTAYLANTLLPGPRK